MTKPKLNTAAFRKLRNSPGVQHELLKRAKKIAAAAGPGFEASVRTGTTRARANVKSVTTEAMRANSKDNVLVRAMEAGRD